MRCSNSRSKVCVKYAGPMELWNDALVTTCEGQSRRRFSPLRLSANTEMLRTACFLCVIGHRELLYVDQNLTVLDICRVLRISQATFYRYVTLGRRAPETT